MSAPAWTPGTWSDVEAGDWVLGNDGYTWLVTAMATVGDDTHVFIARPGHHFDFDLDPLRRRQAVRYYRPPFDPQAVDKAVDALRQAGFEPVVIEETDSDRQGQAAA